MTHACYLLRSLNPRFKKSFYIGCTTDPQRRLRQHNGERGQGAHFTKAKRPWEMVLCVYGFSSHVNALQFEWAWQHPFLSLAVRGAAAQLPSLKGVPGMITLVCTMVTLPKWNSLNLTLQFMLSSLLQHRQGSPPLPPHMRLIVAPIDSLPGKDSEDDNDDNEDLSTCRDALSQSVELDEDSYLNASSFAVDVQAGAIKVGLTAEFHTSHDITSSPCPPMKGKKSRKGKTPQGRKGKRGGTHKPSEDPILVDLRLSGSGSRTLFVEKEISSAERSELNDSSVVDDSRTTLTIVETMCTSSGSQRGRIDDYWYSADLSNSSPEERIPSKFDSMDDSRGSAEIDLTVFGTSAHSGSQEERAASDTLNFDSKDDSHGPVEIDLTIFGTSAHSGSQEERAASDTLNFDSTDDSHGPVEIDLTIFGTSAHSGSQEERAASDTFSKQDLPYASIGERFSFQGTSKVQSSSAENRASAMTLKTGETAPASHVSQGQRMDIYSVSKDLPSRSMEENFLSKVLVKDHHSKGPIANDRDSVCESKITGAATKAERVGYGQGEKIGSHAVSCKHSVAKSPADRGGRNYEYGIADELSSKCFGERGPSDGISGDPSQKNFVCSSFLEGVSVAKAANHESDSDIEEISVEEFRTVEGRRKGFAVDPTCSKGGDACCVPPSASENDMVQMSVREKNVLEEQSVKGVDLQQKSLKSFFPIRKQGTVPTSIYRKARNGEICKVLEEHSSTRNAPIEIGSKGKSSGIQQALKSSSRERVQDATLLFDSDDDDEIQEISVSEFKESSLTGKQGVTGRNEKVCSLRNFR